MGILVLYENGAEGEAVTSVLRKASYRTERTSDLRGARELLLSFNARTIVFAWPRTGGPEFVRWIRARDVGTGHTYILALVEKQGTDLRQVVAAGVDDFAWRPTGPEEILIRVDGARRMRKWAQQLKAGDSDWSAYSDARRLRSCQELGAIVAEDLTQMLGEGLDVVEGWWDDPQLELRGATIPMLLSSELSEVRIHIRVETLTTPILGEKLLGDPGAPLEAIDDILRELANAAGGAMKRAGLAEGVTFTTGLPVNPSELLSENDRTSFWMAAGKESGVRIGIAVEVRAQTNQKVAANELREGMVLASDVRNDGGVLLIAAGTRITATTAERIRKILDRKATLEIARAA